MSRFFAIPALLLALGCTRQADVPAVRVDPAPVVTVTEAPPAMEVAPPPHAARPRPEVAPAPHEPGVPDLTNEDIGLDPQIEKAPLPEIEVGPGAVPPEVDLTAPPVADPPRLQPNGLVGSGRTDSAKSPDAFGGRGGGSKAKLLKDGGGTAESERAVALGLAWLARQQKPDGGWEFDGREKKHRAAATGLAVLPFLAAGETHKSAKGDAGGRYAKTVSAGLAYLVKVCPVAGQNPGQISANMYEQAIAALALCEAYGMTKDPALRQAAQAAINFIMKAQGSNGSWGYAAGNNGDTSIVGWQVQALHAARLTKDLVVDDRVIKGAVKFLDFAAAGPRKAMYGYNDSKGAAAGTSLTAVGLLCRYDIDGWGPNNPGMIEGVTGLMKHPPAGKGTLKNVYYYYYATQAVHFYDGEDWKTWNEGPKVAGGKRAGGMRDWLVGLQNRKGVEANVGSWDPDGGIIGMSCGRLGTSSLCLLTLEVYYRHLPLYKRQAEGK
jgi:hypothetical protein